MGGGRGRLIFPPATSSSMTHTHSRRFSFSFDDVSIYVEYFPKLFFDDAQGIQRAVRGKK